MTNPARIPAKGEQPGLESFVSLFGNAFGIPKVGLPPIDEPAGSSPLPWLDVPTILAGTQEVGVQYYGLAPDLFATGQANVFFTSNITPGALPIRIVTPNGTSKPGVVTTTRSGNYFYESTISAIPNLAVLAVLGLTGDNISLEDIVARPGEGEVSRVAPNGLYLADAIGTTGLLLDGQGKFYDHTQQGTVNGATHLGSTYVMPRVLDPNNNDHLDPNFAGFPNQTGSEFVAWSDGTSPRELGEYYYWMAVLPTRQAEHLGVDTARWQDKDLKGGLKVFLPLEGAPEGFHELWRARIADINSRARAMGYRDNLLQAVDAPVTRGVNGNWERPPSNTAGAYATREIEQITTGPAPVLGEFWIAPGFDAQDSLGLATHEVMAHAWYLSAAHSSVRTDPTSRSGSDEYSDFVLASAVAHVSTPIHTSWTGTNLFGSEGGKAALNAGKEYSGSTVKGPQVQFQGSTLLRTPIDGNALLFSVSCGDEAKAFGRRRTISR